MKIFSDFHHDGLFYSLQLLFEKRLGYELYRPIGLEWYTEGYWNVYPHLDTAKQFLGLDQPYNKPRDIHGNELPPGARCNETYTVEGDTYFVIDPKRGVVQKGIELETFKNTKFDIIISSIPQHIQPFNMLIQLYQPQAKHIFQIGNPWGYIPGVKNLLVSAARFPVPQGINVCFYHQEFDLDQFCLADTVSYPKRVRSYIHIMENKNLMFEVSKCLPDWDFGCHGASADNHPLDKGDIMKTKDVAEAMKQSGFTWHFKTLGDGMGLNIFGAFAIGSIPIIWPSHYRGKLASELITPSTCVWAEGKNPQQIAKELEEIESDSDRFWTLRRNACSRFHEVVDYDKEEVRLRNFIGNLQ